jgi:Flp pilus assembly protein TadD
VYKLSGESANKENDRRAQLLAEHPELSDLFIRIQQNAADKDARSQLVAAYFDHQLYWAAYELLTAADAMNEADSETNLNLARIWDVWGQYDLALRYGERAMAAGDSSPRALEIIGRIHLHRNEPAAAISWYTRAAEHSDNARVLANLGYAYILVSDWENAKTNLEKALTLDGTLPEPHNNLAVVLMKLGDDKAALSELQKTAPAHVAFNNMGVLYLQEQKLARAQELFEEALQLAPKYEVAQRNLSTLQALMPPVPVPEALLDSPPQNARINVDGNCPATDEPGPTLVQTELQSTAPVDTDFRGSKGMLETDVAPSAQQTVSELAPGDTAAPARLQIKKPQTIERIEHGAYEKGTGKAGGAAQIATTKAGEAQDTKSTSTGGPMPTAFESNGMGCRSSGAARARHNNPRPAFNFDHQQLSMCGIIALLLGTAAAAVRRNKPSVIAKVTLK